MATLIFCALFYAIRTSTSPQQSVTVNTPCTNHMQSKKACILKCVPFLSFLYYSHSSLTNRAVVYSCIAVCLEMYVAFQIKNAAVTVNSLHCNYLELKGSLSCLDALCADIAWILTGCFINKQIICAQRC